MRASSPSITLPTGIESIALRGSLAQNGKLLIGFGSAHTNSRTPYCSQAYDRFCASSKAIFGSVSSRVAAAGASDSNSATSDCGAIFESVFAGMIRSGESPILRLSSLP